MDWDTILSFLCVIVSGYGAYKSNIYYKKSKQLTTYAHKNTAYSEIKKVIAVTNEILKQASPHRERGTNRAKEISRLGLSIRASLNVIREQLSNENCETILITLNSNEVRDYVESLITCSVLPDGVFCIDQQFHNFETAINIVQTELKKRLEENEEELSV